MKLFYQPVDLRSRQTMIRFLTQHFRYPTMNSWNRSISYACNLKLYNLGLEREIEDKLYELIQTQEFFDIQAEMFSAFGSQHQFRWQVGMNGRSSGYLVLYQGELKPSGYQSYCTSCGQRNYQKATDTNNICGVCRQPTRVNFPRTHMQVGTFPGRGTDDNENFEDWNMYDLRDRVGLVQELDQLADKMVAEALHLAQNFDIAEEEYYVPQKRMVLVESAV